MPKASNVIIVASRRKCSQRCSSRKRHSVIHPAGALASSWCFSHERQANGERASESFADTGDGDFAVMQHDDPAHQWPDPSPSPPAVMSRWGWVKGRKTSSSKSGAMPRPVSLMLSTPHPPSCALDTVIVPPAGVNFRLFCNKFPRHCCNRCGSAWTQQRHGCLRGKTSEIRCRCASSWTCFQRLLEDLAQIEAFGEEGQFVDE